MPLKADNSFSLLFAAFGQENYIFTYNFIFPECKTTYHQLNLGIFVQFLMTQNEKTFEKTFVIIQIRMAWLTRSTNKATC